MVLRRAWLWLCGRLTAKKILKLLCIHPDKVCKSSGPGDLHFNVLHQSTKYVELLAPRNPSGNFSFLQLFILFFVINLLQHSQCTEQNCIFFFTAAAATVSHCLNKHVSVCNGLHLKTSLAQLSRFDCFATITCNSYSCITPLRVEMIVEIDVLDIS